MKCKTCSQFEALCAPRSCQSCHKSIPYIDKLCETCSNEKNLCETCGKDVNWNKDCTCDEIVIVDYHNFGCCIGCQMPCERTRTDGKDYGCEFCKNNPFADYED